MVFPFQTFPGAFTSPRQVLASLVPPTLAGTFTLRHGERTEVGSANQRSSAPSLALNLGESERF